MIVSAMLFHHKLTKALLSYSFELDSYNLCVANEMVNGEQLTIYSHVDVHKSSYIDPKLNDGFYNRFKTHLGNMVKSKRH